MAPQTGQKRPHTDSARQGKPAPGKKTFGGNSSYNKGGARPVKSWPSKNGAGGGGGDRAAGAGGAGGDKGKGKWQWSSKPSAPRGGGGGGGGGGRGGVVGAGAEAKIQRKRPITAPARAAGDDEDEDEDVSMSSDEGAEGLYANPNPDVVNDAGGDEPGEKRPRLSKAEKAALHAAQPHRVTLLPQHALLQELLPLWERARRAEMEKEERRVAIKELYEGVKGRVLEVGRGHKGGRILQTVSGTDGVGGGRNGEWAEAKRDLTGI